MLASCFVNSVFPTPVGPANKNDPIGLSLFLRPILDNFIAEIEYLWPHLDQK